jgi:predicted metal-binding membrane protein
MDHRRQCAHRLRVNRKEEAAGSPLIPTGAFATGYLIAWANSSSIGAPPGSIIASIITHHMETISNAYGGS